MFEKYFELLKKGFSSHIPSSFFNHAYLHLAKHIHRVFGEEHLQTVLDAQKPVNKLDEALLILFKCTDGSNAIYQHVKNSQSSNSSTEIDIRSRKHMAKPCSYRLPYEQVPPPGFFDMKGVERSNITQFTIKLRELMPYSATRNAEEALILIFEYYSENGGLQNVFKGDDDYFQKSFRVSDVLDTGDGDMAIWNLLHASWQAHGLFSAIQNQDHFHIQNPKLK